MMRNCVLTVSGTGPLANYHEVRHYTPTSVETLMVRPTFAKAKNTAQAEARELSSGAATLTMRPEWVELDTEEESVASETGWVW